MMLSKCLKYKLDLKITMNSLKEQKKTKFRKNISQLISTRYPKNSRLSKLKQKPK